MMKSIDTLYNGNYFRSRLEARWAVFFDLLNIKYQYEPEGFKLVNGIYYLPDFLLTIENTLLWVEVKPIIDIIDCEYEPWLGGRPWHDDYTKKWLDFAREKSLLILFGPPARASKGYEILLPTGEGKKYQPGCPWRSGIFYFTNYFKEASYQSMYDKANKKRFEFQ